MDVLSEEYFKILDIISNYDAHLVTIKGWSITVGLALIGYAYQQRQKSLLLVCCVSAICFSFVDAKFKEYQVSYYPRMQQIEECVNTTYLPKCKPLQIDKSWNENKKWYGVFRQYGKLGVLMPHLILFLLSSLLYFNSKYFEKHGS